MGNFRLVKSICLIVGLVLVSISFSEGGRTPLRVKNGIVTSASRLASDAGVSALKQGGNAVDAAITTAFALAVTLPSAGNIGGGGFMVYHGEDGHATTFDFREKAINILLLQLNFSKQMAPSMNWARLGTNQILLILLNLFKIMVPMVSIKVRMLVALPVLWQIMAA